MKIIPFKISSKRIKHLGINQESKRLFTENNKTLLKEIEEDVN